MAVQLATRIPDEQASKFREYTSELGTTPSDAMRMLVVAFVQNKGFPCEIRLKTTDDEKAEKRTTS